MNIKIREDLEEIAEKSRVLFALDRLLLKPGGQEIINQMYIDFWFELDSFPPTNKDMSLHMGIGVISNKRVVTLTRHYTPSCSYDEIADVANGFGYSNSIRHTVHIQKEVGGFIFVLEDFKDAVIPEEDMKLLISLGKTKTSVTEASVSTDIFCEFSDSPF